MRVVCHLRAIRGDRTLAELLDSVGNPQGLSRGLLSQMEHGRLIPTDLQRPVLEEAYEAPAHTWYEPALLLLLQRDHEEAHAV